MMRRRLSSEHFTKEQFALLCHVYGHRCLACGEIKPLCADHIVSLSIGGSDGIENIQPLCWNCNSVKHTKVVDYRKSAKVFLRI